MQRSAFFERCGISPQWKLLMKYSSVCIEAMPFIAVNLAPFYKYKLPYARLWSAQCSCASVGAHTLLISWCPHHVSRESTTAALLLERCIQMTKIWVTSTMMLKWCKSDAEMTRWTQLPLSCRYLQLNVCRCVWKARRSRFICQMHFAICPKSFFIWQMPSVGLWTPFVPVPL